MVVFFSCSGASKFIGAATITDGSGATTASGTNNNSPTLEWLSTQHVPYHMVR